MPERTSDALADKKSIQIAALIFVICFGMVMAVLNVPRGILGSGAVYLLLRNFFHKQFRELDDGNNPVFHKLWRWGFGIMLGVVLLCWLLMPTLEVLMGRELPNIRIGNVVNIYLVIYLLGLVLFHRPQGADNRTEHEER